MGTAIHDEITTLERETREALDRGVVLAGRHFRRQTAVTFERNTHTAKAARDTGLATIGRRFDPIHDDVDDEIEGRILDAFANGTMIRFLACALCEDETPWTPAIAERNATFLRGLTDPVDQATLYDIASWVLLDFFLNAGGSWRIFLKYLQSLSETTRTIEPCDDARAAGDETGDAIAIGIATGTTEHGARAGMSTSVSGTPSSARSPESSIETH